MRWLLIVVVFAGLASGLGCREEPSNPSVNLAPSALTVEQVKPMIRRGMAIDEIGEKLQTTPILPDPDRNRFRWRLADGDLWTDFAVQNGRPLIVSWEFDDGDPTTPRETGDDGSVQYLLMHYYRNPEPDRIGAAIAALSTQGYLAQEGAIPPMSAFFGAVFAGQPGRIAEWSKAIAALPAEHREPMHAALWRSRTPEGLDALRTLRDSADPSEQAAIDRMLESEPPDLMTRPIESRAHVDELWASFFATGDVRYVDRICDVFAWTPEEIAADPAREAVVGMAEWSAASNAQRHQRVLDRLVELSQQVGEPARSRLEEVVARATGG